jgi:hypothetical protein
MYATVFQVVFIPEDFQSKFWNSYIIHNSSDPFRFDKICACIFQISTAALGL